MAKPVVQVGSKNHINKCGKLLRDRANGAIEPDFEEVDHAIEVLTEFRNAHAYPMTKVRLGVASMVRTAGVAGAVSQRHKRVPRIIRKLQRMDSTSLARLEDIAGCRAVVANGAELEKLCGRIWQRWEKDFTREPRNYIEIPKEIGYRAVHFVVKRDERAVEVQVRTKGQQQWADAVEAIDSRRGLNLKDGYGPESLVEYFSVAGEVIYRREYALPVAPELLERFQAAQDRVVDEGYYDRRR